ncbi:MAG: SRPBCC family protein, partial [Chloroflexota bacterium]
MSASVSNAPRGHTVVLEHAVDIRRSPEAVFDYCADLTREPEWNPKIKRVAKLSGGPEGVGTHYEAEFVPGDPMRIECVRFDRPTAWAMVGASRRLKANFEGRVQASEEGAHLVMRMELLPRGLLAVAAPLLRRYMQGQQARNVAAITARLEGCGEHRQLRAPANPCRATHLLTTARAAWKTAVCLLKVFPMLPSRPLDWVTPRPVVERLRYRTSHGWAEGELYRPAGAGPHPGVVVCLGVVPFGVEHPQVPRLGEALARSGFAALLYWSPAMRDFRLDPADVEDIASAYEALLARPEIDPRRSGLLGTCVGGAFALMAGASPRIRDRVAFVFAYAAYASMWTLARDIAS